MSPRMVTRFSMPRDTTSSQCRAISSRLASMPVTWTAPSIPSRLMRSTISAGASRGLPPVRVTETNDGASGRSASSVRSREASPSAVRGGKNSKETTGTPRPNSSLICTPVALAGRALLLQRLHPLILPVVVAGGHGHEHGIHAAVALAAQDTQSFVELAEILVGPQARVRRAEEEVAHPGDREAEGG